MSLVDEKLYEFATRYCWDMDPSQASQQKDRVILRVMDLGVWNDVLDLEQTFRPSELRRILQNAPAGAMRPRSWYFWHYRLKLANADKEPPEPPMRRVA